MSQETASAVFLFGAVIQTVPVGVVMGMAFWGRRFVIVLAGAFVVIAAVQLLKGHPAAHAAGEGLLWAAVSAAVFVGARIAQSRRGRHCALYRDTPELAGPPQG